MSELGYSKTELNDRVDNRGEWFREWDASASFIYRPPNWYWVGMVFSAIWIVGYLLIYPSVPLLTTHWKGLGVPGGCQPWSAICEMRETERGLDAVRGGYLNKIRVSPVEELANDLALGAFIKRAAKVPFAENCAACHGTHGAGIAALPNFAPALNDEIWLYGGSVQAIERSIKRAEVHPFGMAIRTDEVRAKMLAVYVYKKMW
jgi:cytochrome c oxidase cbb3-type subunit 3